MIEPHEKCFTVSFHVSCKKTGCSHDTGSCDACLQSVVSGCVRKFEDFKASQVMTSNHSRQFGVSFTALCRKPDCASGLPRAVACCTAHPDKCEMCLRTVVGQNVRMIQNFHVKEICVV